MFINHNLSYTDPIRYYALHDYHDLKEIYLRSNKDIYCNISDPKFRNKKLSKGRILFKVYKGLSLSNKKRRHKILTSNLIIYLYPKKDDIDCYYCVVKKENKILFSSEELKESFDFCHKIQSESVIDYTYDVIKNFKCNNGCEIPNDRKLLDFILDKTLSSTNSEIVYNYRNTIIENIPFALAKIKAEKEREILLNSIKLESNISEARKKRI